MANKKAVRIALYDDDTSKWEITAEGKAYLRGIQSEVCVVGIAGGMRLGKSYIMNLLADRAMPERQNKIFELGAQVVGKTRGVWAFASVDAKTGKTILLLDFEGMYDPERINQNFDAQIFTLAVLCSSYFLYNTQTLINEQHLDQLSFVASIGEQMKLSKPGRGAAAAAAGGGGAAAAPDDDGEDGHDSHFPDHFTWVVRDAFLDQMEMTDKQLLETKLAQTVANTPAKIMRNATRAAITRNFRNRDCCTLIRPVREEAQLRVVDDLPFSQLEANFRTKVQGLVHHVLDTVRPKTIKDQRGAVNQRMTVTGPTFGVFFETLLQQLNTSHVFCVQDAWSTVSTAVTKQAFDAAVQQFEARFAAEWKPLPLESHTPEWRSRIDGWNKGATDTYLATAILRDGLPAENGVGAESLKNTLAEVEKTFQAHNMAASQAKVSQTLDQWVQELEQQLKGGALKGYDAYEEAKTVLLRKIKPAQDDKGCDRLPLPADCVKGKMGPAWLGMEAALLARLKNTDGVAALTFKLSGLELEAQQMAADANQMRADQDKLRNELLEQQANAKLADERWQETQAKMKKAHDDEMADAREQMDRRMQQLQEEQDELRRQNQVELAEQREASKRNLEAAIANMQTEHQREMQIAERRQQDAMHRMEQQQAQMRNEMAAAQKKAADMEAEHRKKLSAMEQRIQEERQKQPAQAQSGLVAVFAPTPWGLRLVGIQRQ